MGVAQALRATCPRVKVHPLEPAESPTLSTGHKVGRHRIQGVSDEFIPSICKISSLDDVIAVHDGDAILMAQRLAQELGLGVGISSGANLLGALQLLQRHGWSSTVATVFCDDNKNIYPPICHGKSPCAQGISARKWSLSVMRRYRHHQTVDCPAIISPSVNTSH